MTGARIRMGADELIHAIHSFLDAARTDLSPEDHERVVNATVDKCDELLDAQEAGHHDACNLPASTT
ncbi:MAG: hypothetical protein BWY85_00059 [Firmicutes bacterium ADurb.Bin506]|nr:MAG: hypothetical protein BWY85_00059 [Firmicutes bacterium ADurb.Bin506]